MRSRPTSPLSGASSSSRSDASSKLWRLNQLLASNEGFGAHTVVVRSEDNCVAVIGATIKDQLDNKGLDFSYPVDSAVLLSPTETARDDINVAGTGTHPDVFDIDPAFASDSRILGLGDDEPSLNDAGQRLDIAGKLAARPSPATMEVGLRSVKSVDDGSASPPAGQSRTLAHSWEESVIPWAKGTMPPNSSLNLFGDDDKRMVLFTTLEEWNRKSQDVFCSELLEKFPEPFRAGTSVCFAQGSIVRCQDPPAQPAPYPVCPAVNACGHQPPMGGDSIGTWQDPDTSGTLWLQLQIGDTPYYIINCHVLDKALKEPEASDVFLCHPSYADHTECQTNHKFCPKADCPTSLGRLVSHSGVPYETWRNSTRIFGPKNPSCKVVTDYAVFETFDLGVNSVRNVGKPIIRSAEVKPGQQVTIVGRTTGLTKGRVGLVPALVRRGAWTRVESRDGKHMAHETGNRTSVDTREWSIEYLTDSENWIVAGAGKPGDSGSPVLDRNNSVLGMLFGRNNDAETKVVNLETKEVMHERRIPVAYFSLFDDICDDIQDKMGTRPVLPTESSIAEVRARALAAEEAAFQPPTSLPHRASATRTHKKTSSAEFAEFVRKMAVSIGNSFPAQTTSPLELAA